MDQTSSVNAEARRQRRIVAGRSGGVFELVRDGEGLVSYQYASPSSSEAYNAESHQTWESTESLAYSYNSISSFTEFDNGEVSLTSSRATGDKTCDVDAARKNWTFMGTKTLAQTDSAKLVTTEPETKTGKRRRVLKKIKDKFVSGIVHRKKTASKEDNTVDIGDLNIENSLPFTPPHQVRRSEAQMKTPSPVKEQLALEADQDLRNEEVDKEFFTPPRMTKISTGRESTESEETDIFG